MLKELKIPRMGSVENAKLIEWHLDEGAAFSEGDVLYEVETDKTTTEVEASESGVLARRLAVPGDEFKVGDPIGLWAQAGTSLAALRQALAELDGEGSSDDAVPELAAAAVVAAAPRSGLEIRPLSLQAAGGTRISPLARRLAAQHSVDVSGLTGTGAQGKITGKDVLAASGAAEAPPRGTPVAAPSPVTPVAAPAVATPAPPPAQPCLADEREAAVSAVVPAGAEIVPHSLRRRTIARRMVEASQIPSLTADIEVDLTALFAHKASPDGQGASVFGLIATAIVASLLEHPRLNAHWREDAMLMWSEVHLGVAVDTPDGLVVPVIRNAEKYSARGLTAEIAQAAEKARDGRLRAEDLDGGTFTISNPGSLGPVLRAEALINPPQVALLGLPGIARVAKPVPDGSGWALSVRQVIRPSLTFDHRAFDGGPAIAFLNTLKSRIESL